MAAPWTVLLKVTQRRPPLRRVWVVALQVPWVSDGLVRVPLPGVAARPVWPFLQQLVAEREKV